MNLVIKLIRIVSAFDAFFRSIPRLFINPPWERTGQCRQCGTCCKLIGIEMENKMAHITMLRKLVIWWVDKFNGFQFKEWDQEHQVLLFTCRHFKDNKCTYYKGRPQLCRDYPVIRNYFKPPIFFPECGYKAVLRK